MKVPDNKKQKSSVLLMGLPNVGKSVLFNTFTGMEVSCANYAGTTVEYSSGVFKKYNNNTVLIDVPGTYTLEASNEAEQVAVDMLSKIKGSDNQINSGDTNKPSAIICVLDAVNLESSLYLLYQILQYNIPVIAALNRMDLAHNKGITIDHKALERLLSVSVVPTVAIKSEGLETIVEKLAQAIEQKNAPSSQTPSAINWKPTVPFISTDCDACQDTLPGIDASKTWEAAERVTSMVQKTLSQDNLTAPKKWEDALIKPFPGLIIAIMVLICSFALVTGLGMGIRRFFLLPAFRAYIEPFISNIVLSITTEGIIRNILIGEYGFLIKGLEWPLALVFPYVISFYLMMAILEDSGYLPRLAALLDGLMNRFGMSGQGIIPILLGYGCAIPAIMATRSLNTKKERVIAASLICLTVPCISQSGAFITLLAEQSVTVMIAIFILSFFAACTSGIILNKMLSGKMPVTIMALPEMLPPKTSVIFQKVWIRTKRYITDGVAPMILAVAIAAFLYETGLMASLGNFLSPLVTGWLRLPKEAAAPLILGIMRRELSILPLLDMNLTTLQLFTGAVTGLFYVPCIAVVVTLAKEFSIKMSMLVLAGTSLTAFITGGLIAQLGRLF